MNSAKAILRVLFAFIKTTPGLLTASLVLTLTPLKIVSFALLIIIVARLIPLVSGVITRLAISFSLVSCISGCVAVVAWLVHAPLNATSLLLALTVIISVWAWVMRKHTGAPKKLTTNAHELSALGLAVVTVMMIALPALKDPNGASLLRIISAGGDNSAHLTMVKAIDLNQGVGFGGNNRVNQMPGAVNYPQFWHFNVASYKWFADATGFGKIDSASKVLAIFYGASLLWFGLLVFLMTRLGLRVAEIVTKKSDLLGLIAALGVCAAITAHWLLQLSTYGFQSQTGALLLLVAEIYMLVEAFRQSSGRRYAALIVAGFLAVGSSLTWTLLIPPAAGAFGLCVLITIFANKKLPSLPVSLLTVLVGAFIIFQPLLLYIFPVSFEGGVSMIQQRGLINPVSMGALLTIFIVCLLYAWVNKTNKSLRVIAVVAAGTIAFSFGLMVYQLHTLGELRYFYHKSAYGFVVIGGALLAAAAYHFAHTLFKDRGRIVIALLLCALAGLAIWHVKDPAWRSYQDTTIGGMSSQAAAAVVQQINLGPLTSANTTFLGACNRGDDIRANLFTTALTKTMIYKSVSFDPGGHNEKFIFAAIALHLRESDVPITIISSDLAISGRLKTHLGELASRNTFKLIDLDNTEYTEPISQCPDRIRDITQFPVQ